MESIKENPCLCIKCEGTVRFCTWNENEKRRHVAIVHGRETFSTLRCGKCQRKYYDFDHFSEHLETSPECLKDSWMIKPEPLSDHLKTAFDALVKQMMRPISEHTVKTDQTEKETNSGGDGDGEMGRTNGEVANFSMISSTGDQSDMDGVKRRRVMDSRHRGGTGETTAAGGDLSRVNEQFKFQLATLRREYCFILIDKFATAAKLQCQLCSVLCAVIRKSKGNLAGSTDRPIQHALGHLKKPIYRCRVCNTTKFTIDSIRNHVKDYHPSSEEGYENFTDQYHEEIMNTLQLLISI